MSRRRRLGWAAAVLVTAGGLAVGGWAVSALASPGGPAAPAGSSGRVVVQTSAGELALARPGASTVQVLHSLAASGPGSVPPYPSADGRYLVTTSGTVLAVSPTGLRIVPSKVRLGPEQSVPAGAGLADHDAALIVASPAGGSTSNLTDVAVAPLASGRPTALGLADGVTADPAALGVFVSVPSPQPPPASTSLTRLTQVDLRVERRDAGGPPFVLATAAALNRDLGWAPVTPVGLFAEPDAAGDRIAVAVLAADGTREGVVVLNRTGHVIAIVPSSIGMAFGYSVTWSPQGDALAFFTAGGSSLSTSVEVWTLSGGSTAWAVPAGEGAGGCVWSQDGAELLCIVPAADSSTAWLLVTTHGGQLTPVPPLGNPVVWLPDPSARTP